MLSPLLLTLALVSQAGDSKAEWKPFTSPKGKFTISMPVVPSEKKRILAAGGKTIEVVTATARKGLAVYSAAYAALNGADPEAAIRAAQADSLAQSKGELKDDHEVTLGEVAGRELAIEIPRKVMAGGGGATVRLFVVKGRLYMLSASLPTAKAEALADDVATFLDSFQVEGQALAASEEKPKAEAKPKTSAGAATKGKPETAKTAPATRGTGAVAKAGAAAKKSRLVEFSPPDRIYVIKMPASPKASSDNRASMMGSPIETKIFSAKLGDTLFMVSSEPAEGHSPTDARSADRLLGIDKMKDVEIYKYVVKSEKRLVLGDAPGIELEMEMPADDRKFPGGGLVTKRIFIVGMTSYTVAAVTPTGRTPSPEVAEFLDSFEAVVQGKRTGRAAARDMSWAAFTPETGEFTVLMPGKPARNSREDLTGQGKMTMTTYAAEAEDREFSVEVEQSPGRYAGGDAAKLLEIYTDTILKVGAGLTVKTSKDLQVNGRPGREHVYEKAGIGKDKPETWVRRVVVDTAKGRVYTVEVHGPLGCQGEKAVRDFLESFKIK